MKLAQLPKMSLQHPKMFVKMILPKMRKIIGV
jgi:hypothetical protein